MDHLDSYCVVTFYVGGIYRGVELYQVAGFRAVLDLHLWVSNTFELFISEICARNIGRCRTFSGIQSSLNLCCYNLVDRRLEPFNTAMPDWTHRSIVPLLFMSLDDNWFSRRTVSLYLDV